MKGSGKKSRPAFRKKRAPGRKLRRAMNSEIASLKQSISFSRNQLQANTIYGLYNWSLTSCDRAVQVAKAYQFYRITKIEVIVKPNIDTFTQSGGQSVPYLYYMVDKGGNFVNANVNFNSLRDAGCKARRFDDKTIKLAFKPSVLQSVYDAGTQAATSSPFAQHKISPWLNTNANALQTGGLWVPNGTDHYGMIVGVEQDNGTPVTYDIDMVIHYQFKKPRYESLATVPIPFVMPDLDLPAYAGGDPQLQQNMLDA